MLFFWLIVFLMILLAIAFCLWPLYKKGQKNNKYAVLAFVLLIPAFSLALYAYWGNSGELSRQISAKHQLQSMKHQIAQYQRNPALLITKMQTILQANPNSDKGWFLLGRLYVATNKPKEALNAFAKAYQLQPNNLAYTLSYVEGIFLHNNQLTEQAKLILKNILDKYPRQPLALNFLALDAYQHKNYQLAIEYWQKALLALAPDDPQAKVVSNAIESARKKLNNKV